MRRTLYTNLSLAVLCSAVSGMQAASSNQRITAAIPCAASVRDQSGGACLRASSTPTLGSLYPLSTDLFLDPATGWTGLGTTNPLARLTVGGDALLDGDLRFGGVTDGIQFSSINPLSEAPVPMMRLFQFGTSNPDRMVFAHSDAYSDWGLEYSDAGDRFTFQAGAGAEVLTIDLTRRNVTVDGGLLGTSTLLAKTAGASNAAIRGSSTATTGIGIEGFGATGVVGGTTQPGGYGVSALGGLGATGLKTFQQPHPTDATKEIRYVALEGNEAGTYFRGTSRLEGGVALLEIPEDFRLVTEPEGITVQVTPLGNARAWVEEQSLGRIVVRGDRDVRFNYFVNGVRFGFGGHQPIQTNERFVPRYRDVPFHPELPGAVRDLLVESGVLNADYTPNEATADRHGWTLRDRPDSETGR